MLQNCEQILPEDPPPPHLTDNERRALTEHSRSRLIWGEGNPHAPLFIVLDNPGAREDANGLPFLCPTRKTLQKAARESHFSLSDLYVSYLLKSRPLGKYDKETARSFSKGYLLAQIERHRPLAVFCLGTTVVQSYFQDPQAEVNALRGRIRFLYGFPTAVSYHPLAVRRRPNLYPFFLKDWLLIRQLITDVSH